ncbi:prolyl-tRNA synthetase associated domain-containing protein [Candidatus Peregrinibacteria bacterium]|nr:prolyl-tRNA synthetase associated domain-containing protein [Candidatus Peregrinibacteria bacterium]
MQKQKLYEILNKLNISFFEHLHPPIFTVEEGKKFERNLQGGKTKNLFVRNAKGNNHYLIVIEADKRADLQKIREYLNETKLSFASSERLKKYLNLTPGSVGVFGLIHDSDKQVKLIVDQDLYHQDNINFHPNQNNATVRITMEGLKTFLKHTGHQPMIFKL